MLTLLNWISAAVLTAVVLHHVLGCLPFWRVDGTQRDHGPRAQENKACGIGFEGKSDQPSNSKEGGNE
jgi:hypothetical protein